MIQKSFPKRSENDTIESVEPVWASTHYTAIDATCIYTYVLKMFNIITQHEYKK